MIRNNILIKLFQKFAQIKNEKEEATGIHTTLRLAHSHLESRLKFSEQRREIIEKENEMQKKTIVILFFI